MSVYTFITQPYRWSEQASDALRTTYATARQIELDGYLTNLADADTVSAALFSLLSGPRLRFEVPVLGVNIVRPSMFAVQAPCAILTSSRFNLQSGRLVIVTDYTVDLNKGQTTLRCWG